MKVINDLRHLHKLEKPSVIALGTFDGLHLGHQEVILAAKRAAQEQDALLAVFTFSNHPLQLIAPQETPQALLTEKQKYALLEEMGVEVLVDLPFNAELASLTPEIFVEKLLLLGVRRIVVGENFTYGHKGAGNHKSLAIAAKERGFELDVRKLITLDDSLAVQPEQASLFVKEGRNLVISSTCIRSLLSAGRIEEANVLLGRLYAVTGTVVHGNERGRFLGYPTANLELTQATLLIPPVGVYAVYVKAADRIFCGMANIGNNPTFGDVLLPRLETHILDFQGDIYGQEITVCFAAKLREQVKFSNIEQLIEQMRIDEQECRKRLNAMREV